MDEHKATVRLAAELLSLLAPIYVRRFKRLCGPAEFQEALRGLLDEDGRPAATPEPSAGEAVEKAVEDAAFHDAAQAAAEVAHAYGDAFLRLVPCGRMTDLPGATASHQGRRSPKTAYLRIKFAPAAS